MITKTKGRGNSNTETYTSSQHIYMSVHKARRVIDQIRGRSYEETLKILELMPYRVCYLIFKLVYSTAANASNNRGFNKEALIISKVEINEGTTVKKVKPKARGRSFSIKRSTCHITIVVKDISLYEYEEYFIWFQKEKRLYKNKYRDMTCHDIYSSGDIWDKK